MNDTYLVYHIITSNVCSFSENILNNLSSLNSKMIMAQTMRLLIERPIILFKWTKSN